jgi:hypothetical protein
MKCHNPHPLKNIPRLKKAKDGEVWISYLDERNSVFPRGFIFRVVILLNLVEPSSLVSCDSVLLIENLGGICLVRQAWLEWDGIFNHNISRGLQTCFELGDVKHVVNFR